MVKQVHAIKAVKHVQAAKAVKAPPAKNNVKPPLQAAKKDVTVPTGSNEKALPNTHTPKMIPLTEVFVINASVQSDNAVEKVVKPQLKANPQKLQEVSAATGFSTDFLKTVIKFEGIRQEPYTIAGGHTIGIGHFMEDDPRYKSLVEASKEIEKSTKKGEKPNTEELGIEEDEIYSLLKEDLLKKKADERKIFPNFDTLKQGWQEALTDLFFNVNPAALKNSKLVKAVRHNQFDKAIKEFGSFSRAGKQVYAGLLIRRTEEVKIAAKGDDPTNAKAAISNIAALAKKRKDVQLATERAKKELDEAWVSQQKDQKNPVVASNR